MYIKNTDQKESDLNNHKYFGDLFNNIPGFIRWNIKIGMKKVTTAVETKLHLKDQLTCCSHL